MGASPPVRNVVVLVVDAMRADAVGAYGSDRGLTPTLDGLAEEATVFENAYACCNATDPSITSIHTGAYPRSTVVHHGANVTQEEKQRVESAEWVPEELAEAGIRTVATGRSMGRWHSRGFTVGAQDSVRQTEAAIGDTLEQIHPALRDVAARGYGFFRDLVPSTGSDAVGEPTAVETLLDEVGDDPFYGYVHLMDTHAPYDAPPDLVDSLLETHEYPDGDLDEFFAEHSDNLIVSELLEPNATEADYEAGLGRLFARYDATVTQADDKLATLIAGLRERGCWDETALVVCSDHGESLDEHGIYFDHHGLYEPTIRVPLVVRLPGTQSDRVEEFVQLHDVGPTVLDWFGVDGLSDVDGRSLAGYLTDARERPEPRERVFVEEAHTQRRVAVRDERYKYIEHRPDEVLAAAWDGDPLTCGYCDRQHGDRTELYDLRSDPDETENLVDQRSDAVTEMRSHLEGFEQQTTTETGESRVTYDDEQDVIERLEDLGYH